MQNVREMWGHNEIAQSAPDKEKNDPRAQPRQVLCSRDRIKILEYPEENEEESRVEIVP
jgi:hypothetical protein